MDSLGDLQGKSNPWEPSKAPPPERPSELKLTLAD